MKNGCTKIYFLEQILHSIDLLRTWKILLLIDSGKVEAKGYGNHGKMARFILAEQKYGVTLEP